VTEPKEFRALGHRVTGALTAAGLERFEVRDTVSEVEFVTEELTAFCPVTRQPDLYSCSISFTPGKYTVESKTLKLYLNSFRDVGIFAEDLCALICQDVFEAIEPEDMKVTLVQQVRGGLTLTSTAVLEKAGNPFASTVRDFAGNGVGS
jgi:7-cyano-7-deazaguanine reductase